VKIYQANNQANRISLKWQLYMYHHDTEKPVMEYVHGILTLTLQLQAIGVELGEEDVPDILIYSLAPEFSAVATALMQRAGSLTVEDISVALVEEESHLKGQKEGTSHSALKAKVEKIPKRSLTCYQCNQKGTLPNTALRQCQSQWTRHWQIHYPVGTQMERP
jgi:hypothetical protein